MANVSVWMLDLHAVSVNNCEKLWAEAAEVPGPLCGDLNANWIQFCLSVIPLTAWLDLD